MTGSELSPITQGRLDSLCCIYAGINLLRLSGSLPSDELAAWELFKRVIEAIPSSEGGNLVGAITEGFEPEDVPWIMEVLGAPSILPCEPSDISNALKTTPGVLVFMKKATEPKTHYSVITSIDQASGDHILFDSYGFDRLSSGSRLDDEEVSIVRAWSLPA